MGGGKQSGNQTVEQKADPWEGQQKFLSSGQPAPDQGIYQLALQAYNQTAKTPYGGQLMAPVDQNQLAARQGQLGLAQQLQQGGGAQDLMGLAQGTARGDYLSPRANPFLSQAIQAAIDPVAQRYQEQILPGLASAAVQQGAYGGARDGLAMGTAAQGFAREAMNTAGQLSYGNYSAERDRQMQAPQLYGQAAQAATLPYQMQDQVGQQYRTDAQDLLDQAYEQWQMQQAAPWAGLPEYAGLITTGQPGSSTTAKTSGSGQGSMGGAIKGALGGGLLGATMISGGWGLPAGALLGGLGGFFG